MRKRWIWVLAAVLIVPPAVTLGVAAMRMTQPVPEPPPVSGTITAEAAGDFAALDYGDTGCVLVNNTWNKQAAPSGFRQNVFTETVDGKAIGGWRWQAPHQPHSTVISAPEVVCGDKPWDAPLHRRTDLPFRVGDKHLVVDFDAGLHATGRYNMSFWLWAVTALPATRATISHEIMIWTVDSVHERAGANIGTVTASGVPFDVFVEKDHGDNSGAVSFRWTYVAFIARRPMLAGTLDTGPLIDFLVQRDLLPRTSYLTSLELGNEVTDGAGTVELKKLSLQVLPR